MHIPMDVVEALVEITAEIERARERQERLDDQRARLRAAVGR